MTSIDGGLNPVQFRETRSQSSLNWKNTVKWTLITTIGLGAIYSFSQLRFGSEEIEDREMGSSLALRSFGDVASATIQAINELALFGLPFALAAPLNIPNEGFQHFINQVEAPLVIQDAVVEPVMVDAIHHLLHGGYVPSDLRAKYGNMESRQGFTDFLTQVKSMEHPADRAVHYRMARSENFQHGEWRGSQEVLRIKEVKAEIAAANFAKTASEEIAWLMRAGEALDLPTNFDNYPHESSRNIFDFLELEPIRKMQELDLGVEIWDRAGKLFLQETGILRRELIKYDLMHRSSFFNNLNEIAAARCFFLAGNAISLGEGKAQSKEFYEKAYEILTSIDRTPLTYIEINLLQKEIADLSGYLGNEIAFLEKKRAADSYGELSIQDFNPSHRMKHAIYKMKRAILLFEAGQYADDLKVQLEFFIQARDIFEGLWEQDSRLCTECDLFYTSPHLKQNFDVSWLHRLRVMVREYQLEINS